MKTGMLFEPMNLDGMSIDPKDLVEAARVLMLLSRYARSKGAAMQLRASGEVDRALYLEEMLESLYKQLPEWARW